MIFFYAFIGLCLLTFGLIIARYRRRAAVQELTFDCRLQQRLLEHKPQLPRPFVRCWYGETHVVAPNRKQVLAYKEASK